MHSFEFFKKVEFDNLELIQQKLIEDKKIHEEISKNRHPYFDSYDLSFEPNEFSSHPELIEAVSKIAPWSSVLHLIFLFFKAEHTESQIHIDNTEDIPNGSKYALNIPILNCELGKTFTNWYQAKPNEKHYVLATKNYDFNNPFDDSSIKQFHSTDLIPNEYQGRQLRIWYHDQMHKVCSLSYTTPHIIDTSTPHNITNTSGQTRVVLSIRFNKFSWEN